MAFAFANTGFTAELPGAIGASAPWVLRLYNNTPTPAQTSVASDFSETSFGGYVPATLNSWGTPFVNSFGNVESDHPNVSFTFDGSTGSETLNGFFVTDAAGNLVWAEQFGGPIVLSVAGQSIVIAPRIYVRSD